MDVKNSNISILIAEDDKDDRMFYQEAFRENGIKNKLHFVKDGDEVMDFLFRRGDYINLEEKLPGLIFLDFHLPKKDGSYLLKEIKENPDLKKIPVIILSASGSPYDMEKCYDLGANCYIIKPDIYSGLVDLIKKINIFWLQTVELSFNA
jgi:two-component system, response regulator